MIATVVLQLEKFEENALDRVLSQYSKQVL